VRLDGLVAPFGVPGEDPDCDHDGLSDSLELHKYPTDPKNADGDWDERREYACTLRSVMHVMAPFDVVSMNDDYQDVRVLAQSDNLLEFEVAVHPYNTVAEAIEPGVRRRALSPEPKAFVTPNVCCNRDAGMRAKLIDELESQGDQLAELDDVGVAREVSRWLLERSQFEDSVTAFAVESDGGRPARCPDQEQTVSASLQRLGRTPEDQFERE